MTVLHVLLVLVRSVLRSHAALGVGNLALRQTGGPPAISETPEAASTSRPIRATSCDPARGRVASLLHRAA